MNIAHFIIFFLSLFSYPWFFFFFLIFFLVLPSIVFNFSPILPNICKGDQSMVTPGKTSVYKYTLEYVTTHLQKNPQRIE